MKIGEKVKKRRKEIKMTQAQLAEGICTQAMISRLEKKKVKPSKELMEKVAKRLEVSMHYFYGDQIEDSDYAKTLQLITLLQQQIDREEYNTVDYLFRSNDTLIKDSLGEEKKFFEWVQSLLFIYKDGEKEKGLMHLVELERDVKDGDLRLNVIDSIGQQYLQKKDYKKAEVFYKEGILSFTEWMNYEKKAALLLNYVISLMQQEKYKESLNSVFKGLDLLIGKNTLAYLGDFFYYKGYCLEKLHQEKEAMDAYTKAYTIFEIQQNEKYALIIKLARSNLEKTLMQ